MKILILPQNIASDISHKVRALRSAGIDARGLAVEASHVQTYTGLSELNRIAGSRFIDRIGHLKNFSSVARQLSWADVIHWTYSFGVLPLRLDERLVRLFNKPGVVQWYGSDIRNPDIERKINPFYDKVYENGYEYQFESAANSYENQKKFADLGFSPIEFPEMAHYVRGELFPRRFRLRQMISLEDHQPMPPDPSKNRPLIVHTPTAPFAKGTQFILQAIESLRLKYDIEFILVQDMSREKALEVMKRCDVFIDQLVLGAFGYASIEAMAFSKPVICYLNPETRKNYPAELPIINADPFDIETKLERLILNADKRTELGNQGRVYVERHHDSNKVVLELIEIYKTVMKLHASRRRSKHRSEC